MALSLSNLTSFLHVKPAFVRVHQEICSLIFNFNFCIDIESYYKKWRSQVLERGGKHPHQAEILAKKRTFFILTKIYCNCYLTILLPMIKTNCYSMLVPTPAMLIRK